jgi:hypothetical protein
VAGEKGNSGSAGMNAAHARVPEVHGAREWALLRAPRLVHRYGDVIPFGVKNKCGVVAALIAAQTRSAVIHSAGLSLGPPKRARAIPPMRRGQAAPQQRHSPVKRDAEVPR